MREQLLRKGKGDLWTSAVAPLHIKVLHAYSEICFRSTHGNYIASVLGFDTTSSIA